MTWLTLPKTILWSKWREIAPLGACIAAKSPEDTKKIYHILHHCLSAICHLSVGGFLLLVVSPTFSHERHHRWVASQHHNDHLSTVLMHTNASSWYHHYMVND